MLRTMIAAAAALALALPLAHADTDPACSGACASLLAEGRALTVQGRLPDALAKYQAAAAAAPKASAPLSAAAHMFLSAADPAKPEQAAVLRKQADGLARSALKLKPDDPLAQEVLRVLLDATPSPLRRPNAAAAAVQTEAELRFARHDYAGALAQYQRIMELDPQYSYAWVGAGDCWYMQHEWAKAEAMFRRATDIEPRNGQAWRFLSDALVEQGRLADGEAALVAGIAADPAQLPSWNKLAGLRAHAGRPLTALALRRGGGVTIGADGKATVSVDADLQNTSGTPDSAVRLALSLAEANARTAKDASTRSPFDIELQAWQLALEVAGETNAAGKKLSDPALLVMQALRRDGQLEPAIFVLLYKEAYRPDYERWLAAHPDGVRTFIDRYGLRP